MVLALGMSEKVGLRVQLREREDLGNSTSELRDAEINRLLNESFRRATDILNSKRREMDDLAQALLKYETLDAKDVEAILGPGVNKSA